ncbi:MAG: tyrosine--tRNA ligase [Patescibacteria group bacterium]
MHKPTPTELNEFLTRRVESIVGEKELKVALQTGKKLTIKFGVDVTSPDIHIGHGVNLWMMRQLQDWGHKVVFLIGGFTTQIGDPTGKSETRKVITPAEIKKNANTYIKQVNKILKPNKTVFEIENNNDWFGKMKTSEFVSLMSQITHAQLIERDMFQDRIKSGREIRMHEMIYPIIQGYDSVMLKSDLTIVGNDQLFNEMMGRTYQEKFGQKPQAIITSSILVGTDGVQKMSKSLGNYISLTDTPKDKFGKTMSINDEAIYDYFRLATHISLKELAIIKSQLKSQNPRDLKLKLAHTIVEMYDGKKAADTAQQAFINQFQKGQLPSDILTYKLTKTTELLDLLVNQNIIASKSEGRRLMNQNGIKLDSQPITNPTFELEKETKTIIQVGKRKFLKLI